MTMKVMIMIPRKFYLRTISEDMENSIETGILRIYFASL